MWLIVEYFDKKLGKYHINKRFLDKNGTRIVEVNEDNLIEYSKLGELEIVKWLWSKCVDIVAKGNRVVLFASANGHLNVVKFLVSKGADVTAENNWAVRWASKEGHLEVVKFLVSKGARL